MNSHSPLELLLFLNSLGNVAPLSLYFDPEIVLKELAGFEKDWQPYNRHKIGNKREGLSLTSLDGGLSGTPDLFSLKDYNEFHKTSHREDDFKVFTPAYKASPELQKALAPIGTLGRSHLLRLGKGGHFPPHRDAAFLEPECFRIFACLSSEENHYSVVINNHQQFFKPGMLYIMNTTLNHSVVSFHDYFHILVVNVPLTSSSVENVTGFLHQS